MMSRGARLEAVERLIALVALHLRLRRVEEGAFARAMLLFRRHYSRRLSFTDCATVAMAEIHGVDFVASFDRGFDGLIARVGQ